MSKIGKKLIKIPEGVKILIDGQTVAVSGPKGELKRALPPVLEIRINDGFASVGLADSSDRRNFKFWGLGRALLADMIKGVSEGFEKSLEFNGVGFKAQVQGNNLELNLGFSHPVIIGASGGVTFQVEKNIIKVMGADKEAVGQIAAKIRAARLPEPYKGTGIRYKGEFIKKKAGKKAVATSL